MIHVTDKLRPAVLALYKLGQDLASDPSPTYSLSGQLYLAESGWIMLSVPNAMVHGVFAAMNELGVELPPGPDGKFNAHISVMRPEEIKSFGGADKVTERGKQFAYSLGRTYAVSPANWPGVSKVWYIKVTSPELQQLRRSYGLSSLPNEGKYDFHITVAIRRTNVLRANALAKGTQ
jgi:hypothetical protein